MSDLVLDRVAHQVGGDTLAAMADPKAVSSAMLSIPVLYLREGRAYIAYTPGLDVSASGTTVARAKKNIETTLRLFLDELIVRGDAGGCA